MEKGLTEEEWEELERKLNPALSKEQLLIDGFDYSPSFREGSSQ